MTDSVSAQDKRAQLNSLVRSDEPPQAILGALTGELAPAALLTAVAADPQWLAQVASSAHRHNNGFDKIVLAAPTDGSTKLVLHVWWAPTERDSTDNIHNHRWDFASVVLCGQVRTELYDDDPDGDPYSALRYTSPGTSGTYTATAAGTRSVTARATLSLSVGSHYLWGKDLLHRAWGVGAPLTATLIVQGRPERTTTTVLLRSEAATAQAESRRLDQLGSDGVTRALAAVGARLTP